MRPRKFRELEDARRWARVGGVALHLPRAEADRVALYAAAQSSEAGGYSRYYAGHAGAVFLEVIDRGTNRESITLTREQGERLAESLSIGPKVGSVPTTVVFFTGTREGMTFDQFEALREWLFARDVVSAHHGLCVGADHQFHEIVWSMRDDKGIPLVVGWPADVPGDLTVLGKVSCDVVKVKRPPLARNKEMSLHAAYFAKLRETKGDGPEVVCVACPREPEPPANGRGGTWHAIRQFRSAGVPVTVITPNGRAYDERREEGRARSGSPDEGRQDLEV